MLLEIIDIFYGRCTDEKEARHVFNVTGSGGILPDEEVPGFKSAVDELTRDFKQLSAMLLTVMPSFSCITCEHKTDLTCFFLSNSSLTQEPINC